MIRQMPPVTPARGASRTDIVPTQPQYQPPQPPRGPAEGVDFRRGMGALKAELQSQIDGLTERLRSGEARIEDLVRSTPNASLGGLAGVPQAALGMLGEAILSGKVQPYVASVNIPIDAGSEGEQECGAIIITDAGPVFVTNMVAYAQIDAADVKAENFPFSLITPPSCNPNCGDNVFTAEDRDATFTLNFGSQLIAGIDVRGMFIPISPRDSRFVTYGSEILCGQLVCPDGTIKDFSATVPLVMLDSADRLDGLVNINVNGCDWQNAQFPLAFFAENWSITEATPGCIGVAGYLDCQKDLNICVVLTRAPRFDTILTFMMVGFRLVTCGDGACGSAG